MSHWRHRSDANTKPIADAFVKLGWLVHRNNGVWDLTACNPSTWRILLVEVKDPNSPNLKRRNKGNDLIDKGWPIVRCLTVEDVIRLAGPG